MKTSNPRLSNFFKHFNKDFPASIAVFFVALPLCLGVALASGAPMFSGIVAGVVGGLIAGFFSGSAVGVSGPAAGLAVIVLGYLTSLGAQFDNAWQIFLLAVLFSGVLQLVAGFLKLGSIAYYFPSSVIKGMLSGIGIIIVLKQIPHSVGYDKDFNGDFYFYQNDGQNTFSELLNILNLVSFPALFASLIGLFILILWDSTLFKKHVIEKIAILKNVAKFLPAPLVAVVSGVIISNLFSFQQEHLVNIPIASSFNGFVEQFSFPDFKYITNPQVYVIGLIIAVVASIETLLCVEATDKLDPQKRITPTNLELKAQGIGNIICGLIGGLPITQVVVRSSANINFGGRTKLSTMLHGLLLLISVISIPKILNMIPLATLASILILIGYKLAKPTIFRDMYRLGLEQFLPFIVTIIGMLLTDLLKGVAMGMIVALIFILYHNFRNAYQKVVDFSIEDNKNQHFISLSDNVSFLNKGAILQMLQEMPNNAKVVIDGSRSRSIHQDIIEIINDFIINSKTKKIDIEFRGSTLRKQIQYVVDDKKITLTKELRDNITPERAIQMLKDGNQRFLNNLKFNHNLLQQVNETSDQQNPFAFILSCIDSRTSAELIFDQGLGDIFSCRIAGNIINDDILGSMEFACKVAGAKLILVLGHSECGAIKGACDKVKMGNLTGLLRKIDFAVKAEETITDNRNAGNVEFVNKVTKLNVATAIEQITEQSDIINEMHKNKQIAIIGGVYDVSSGLVEFYEL